MANAGPGSRAIFGGAGHGADRRRAGQEAPSSARCASELSKSPPQKLIPIRLMTPSEPQTHRHHGASTGRSSVQCSSRWRTNVSSRGPYRSKHDGVVAAQRDADPVARPDQCGHGQEFHRKVEVLPGHHRQAVSPGEAPGHPEPRGARPVRSSPGGRTAGSLRSRRPPHRSARPPRDRRRSPRRILTWPDARRRRGSPQRGGRPATVRT